MGILLELRDISLERGGRRVLWRVNLQVKGGESLLLLGPNGAGKSSLLQVMGGILQPTRGQVLFSPSSEENAKLCSVNPRERRRLFGLVLESSFLYDRLSARENLLFYARLFSLSNAAGRVERLLSEMSLTEVANRRVESFSKGMRQRLSIARALLHEPVVLLLDEPFDGLDESSVQIVQQALVRHKKAGGTQALVTHQLGWAKGLADRAVVMRQGRTSAECATSDWPESVWQEGYSGWLGGE